MKNEPKSLIEPQTGPIRGGRAFIKMHGLRNDFIIVDARWETYKPSVEEIVRICDRREGVGGDELVIIEKTPRPLNYLDIRLRTVIRRSTSSFVL